MGGGVPWGVQGIGKNKGLNLEEVPGFQRTDLHGVQLERVESPFITPLSEQATCFFFIASLPDLSSAIEQGSV